MEKEKEGQTLKPAKKYIENPVLTRVANPNPDPYWVRIQSGQRNRIQSGQWIRIQIQEGKNDPQK